MSAARRTKESRTLIFAGDVLKARRLEMKLSAHELSLMLREHPDCQGVDKSAISTWEHGKYMPDVSYLAAMCDIFNVELRDLLTRRPDGLD